jgi:hypothetical protein
MKVAIPTLALLLSMQGNAWAFCRATTCDPNDPQDDCRQDGSGCVREGVPLRWRTQPIVYRFARGGSKKLSEPATRKAIRSAFDAWSNVECTQGRTSLRFQEGPDIEEKEEFGILFRDEAWPHGTADDALAVTSQAYVKSNGFIATAGIEINTAENEFSVDDTGHTNKIDLEAVITHEVGHYIGLAHSDDPESIMAAAYCQSQDRCGQDVEAARALSEDDRNAVCAIYGPQGEADTSTPSDGGCSVSRSRTSSGLAGVGLAVLALTVIARRRSRARSSGIRLALIGASSEVDHVRSRCKLQRSRSVR